MHVLVPTYNNVRVWDHCTYYSLQTLVFSPIPSFQVSFNPQDNTQVCVVGEKLFKLFRYSEGNLKQFAFMKADPLNYLCQAWLSEDRLVLGSDSGKVQLFEVSELKGEWEVSLAPPSKESPIQSSRRST